MRKDVEWVVAEGSLIDQILAAFANVKGLFCEVFKAVMCV
jgi:hypothetical protein